MDKVLIVRLSSLGDIIHTLPAFAALRANLPDAEITWLVEDKGREVLELVPGLDRIVSVSAKKWGWFSRALRRELRRVAASIRERDQTALDFQGLIKSGLLTWLSRARRRVGFARSDLREPLAGIFYNRQAPAFAPGGHVIAKNLNLLKSLNIKVEKYKFPLDIPPELREQVRSKLEPLGIAGNEPLVVLNVGAAWETKRWPADHWSSLVDELSSLRIFFLLLWGSETERSLAREISLQTGIPISPFFSLQEVMALLREADLVVSGDTFALQAACALSRPVVALFGPTNPGRNGPFREEDKVAFHPLPCSHCYRRTCPQVKCMTAISPEEVASLCRERLEKT